jgi:hypothetical protein
MADHSDLISDNASLSVLAFVQAPYDYNATWPLGIHNYVWHYKENADNEAFLSYRADNQNWVLHYQEGGTAKQATVPGDFVAGEWLLVIATIDTGGDATLYVDSDSSSNDISALGTISPSNWRLGSDAGGNYVPGWAVGQFALLDSILTAEEVAALYQRDAPLVDTGAFDTPGLYILDGRVRLASSLDADRMEFTADELAVYESGNKELWIDIDGFSLRQGDGTLNSIKWYDSSGEGIGQMYASWGGTSSDLVLTVIQAFNSGVSGSASGIMLNAEDTGEDRRLYVMSDGRLSGTSINYFSLENGGTKWVEFDEDGDLSLILGDQGGGDSFRVKDSGSTTRFEVDSSGKVYTYGDVRVGQGLHVGDTSSDPGDGDITCNGTIATNSGEEWNLGGTASGTVSPDTKIHVKIDGSWYTLQAEAGLK